MLAIAFVFLPIFCLYLIHKASEKVGYGKLGFIFWTIMGLWITSLYLGSTSGWFGNFQDFPPRIIIVLFGPLLSLIVLGFYAPFWTWTKKIKPLWILCLQGFRIPVELMLWWAFLEGLIPKQMTFEGGNIDILAGIMGPVVGYMVFIRKAWPTKWVTYYNIGGLITLLNIVIIALLSMPTPFRVLSNEPSNSLVAQWPYIMLPGILVPLAYWLHAISLRNRTF